MTIDSFVNKPNYLCSIKLWKGHKDRVHELKASGSLKLKLLGLDLGLNGKASYTRNTSRTSNTVTYHYVYSKIGKSVRLDLQDISKVQEIGFISYFIWLDHISLKFLWNSRDKSFEKLRFISIWLNFEFLNFEESQSTWRTFLESTCVNNCQSTLNIENLHSLWLMKTLTS